MTRLEDFLRQYKKTGVGELLFTVEELQNCSNKQEHQEKIVVPTIRRIDIDDEILPALYKALKYPGEY